MRISDWSSDVCSSDLAGRQLRSETLQHSAGNPVYAVRQDRAANRRYGKPPLIRHHARGQPARHPSDSRGAAPVGGSTRSLGRRARSEEHTSELQSLMRISYAVFCLKKKKQSNHNLDAKPDE